MRLPSKANGLRSEVSSSALPSTAQGSVARCACSHLSPGLLTNPASDSVNVLEDAEATLTLAQGELARAGDALQ